MKALGRLRDLLSRREALYGINRRNVELVYAHNRRGDYPIADDKLLCKERMVEAGVPVAETLVVCDGLFAIARTLEALADADQFVVKPANGSGGDGIVVVGERLGPGRWRRAGGAELTARALHRHLAAVVLGAFSGELEDRVFVERRVVPHDLYRDLWADGLCDLRIITLHGTPFIAMVRVPTAQSGGKANLHQGGLGLAIDLATGTTVRAVHRGRSVTHHPESGGPLVGLVLPAWEATLDVARRAAAAVPLGYLGVDVVVDRERGPLLLEINARPGLEIQNVCGYGLGAALAAQELTP